MSDDESISNKQKILLLGVAFSDTKEYNSEQPGVGQGFRDRIRCESLEKLNYIVRSLDDKHSTTISKDKKHCQANFADARRMIKSMDDLWNDLPEDKQYDHIILDYFFSPVGWAETRWTKNFYKDTIPILAAKGYLKTNGCIWLPNKSNVIEAINEFSKKIKFYYKVSEVKANDCPLYKATELVEEELCKCEPPLNNENQLKYIQSDNKFLLLTVISEDERPQSSPTKAMTPRRIRKSSSKKNIVTPLDDSVINSTNSQESIDSLVETRRQLDIDYAESTEVETNIVTEHNTALTVDS